jgi:hypothetical protein
VTRACGLGRAAVAVVIAPPESAVATPVSAATPITVLRMAVTPLSEG